MNNPVLIPEVVNQQIREKTPQRHDININLTKADNRRRYEIHNIHTNTTTTTINNNNQGVGFIRFLGTIIFLPFVLVYKLFKFIFMRYDIKNKLGLEYKKNKFNSKMRAWTKKHRDIFTMEEVF